MHKTYITQILKAQASFHIIFASIVFLYCLIGNNFSCSYFKFAYVKRKHKLHHRVFDKMSLSDISKSTFFLNQNKDFYKKNSKRPFLVNRDRRKNSFNGNVSHQLCMRCCATVRSLITFVMRGGMFI